MNFNKTVLISLLVVLTFAVGATENYFRWNDTRIDPVVRQRLEELDDLAANHMIGPLTKNNESGVYTPSVACAAGSDDIAFISSEVVIAGYIDDIPATAEIFAFTGSLTSFDTIEAGYQGTFLVEYASSTFYVTQSAVSKTSLETTIVPKHVKGRVPLAIINLKTAAQWVPGDDWNKANVTTTVHNCYGVELAY